MEVFHKIGDSLYEVSRGFHFVPGVTWMSSPWVPMSVVFGYFAIIHLLERRMEKHDGSELRGVLFVHNALLCLTSSVLFVALALVLLDKGLTMKGDLDWMVCSGDMHNDSRLQLIYFLNYLTKYYELLDTVLLVLRKRPVVFLHEYHHGATLLLAWSQLREHSTVQWVPIVLNLAVHVLMYYYYAMSALHIRVWWKKYLTTMQIIQFVIGVSAAVYCYSKIIYNNFDYSKCHGTDFGAITGIFILFSYLVLFVRFYLQTYRLSAEQKKMKSM